MGIAEEIKKTIQAKLVIRYQEKDDLKKPDRICVICHNPFRCENILCLYIKDEGHICEACGERFAPEMMNAVEECNRDKLNNLFDNKMKYQLSLTTKEWEDIRENLYILQKVTVELARGISRGIVEAPTGHIGLLHYAKDIEKPQRKDGESDKDYDLRVKSHRMIKLFDKIKKETYERINLLQSYFTKLGMPEICEEKNLKF